MAGKTNKKDTKEAHVVNFNYIERKWQKAWNESGLFHARDEGERKRKYYVCEMFPYPSSSFLHMGHVKNYSIGDTIARYKRMNGFNVLYPMGFDAFGLPAENAAIKDGTHPKKYTEKAIVQIKKGMQSLGLSYDWSREISTCDPDYYKWNQWLFLRMLEKGIVYRKKAPVNWCPSCKTVLANEEVVDGKCWRCDNEVEMKQLEQWFVRITKYAEELLRGLDGLDWPQRVKELQRNWIGKSEGVKVLFPVKGSDKVLEVFTTRVDTIYGATFVACSLQHEFVSEFVRGTKYEKKYNELLKEVSASEKLDVEKEKKGFFTGKYAVHPLTNKEVPIYAGTFVVGDYGTGAVMGVPAHDSRDWDFAKKHKIEVKEVVKPVFGKPNEKAEFRRTISAVVKRKDGKFLLVKWKKFGWVAPVIGGIESGEDIGKAAEREVLEETGYKTKFVKFLGGEIESFFFAENKNVWRHRLDQPVLLELVNEASREISSEENEKHEVIWLSGDNSIKEITHNYNNLGIVRYLGKEEAYTGEGKLINSDAFNGLDSETAKNRIEELLRKKGVGGKTTEYKLRDWLISRQRYWGTPIPIVYCKSCGVVPVPEKELPVLLPENVKFGGKGNPLAGNERFVKTRCPCCNEEAKRETDTMATFFDSSWYFLRYCSPKSHDIFDRKNVEYWMPIDQYIGGIEHAVLHLMYARFFTKFLKDLGWVTFDEPFTRLYNQGIVHKDGKRMSKSKGNAITPEEISGKYGIDSARFFLLFVAGADKDLEWDEHGIEGSFRIVQKFMALVDRVGGAGDDALDHKLNITLEKMQEAYERFEFNKGLVAFAELVNYFHGLKEVPKHALETCILMVYPVIPHIAEEMWSKMGHEVLVAQHEWPKIDKSKIDDKFELIEKAQESVISDINNIIKLLREKRDVEAKKVYLYVLPNEIGNYNSEYLSRHAGIQVSVFAVNDKEKYDPQGKSARAKPGRPAIYVE